MTSLFRTRHRVEEFAAAVDGSSGNTTGRSDDVAELLAVVGTLRTVEPIAPRAEFAHDLRSRLLLEADTVLDPATAQLLLPARRRGKRERRLVAAASAFVLIGGSTTMAAAAQSALPGEALYPIKRGIEQAEAGLSFSDAGKGHDLLRQAAARLSEVEGLLADGSTQSAPQVPSTLGAFSESADKGSTLLFDSFGQTSDPQDIIVVRTFAAESIATLQNLAASVPAEAQSELTAAALLLSDIDREAAGLCDTCAPGLPVVEVPGLLLARAEVDRALALAATADLDNNHPVEVSKKDIVRTSRRGTATTKPATEDDGVQAAPTVAPPAAPLPSPTWEPESWPSLLPGIESGTSGTNKSGDEGALEDVTEDLGDAVATLLPDTDGTLLD